METFFGFIVFVAALYGAYRFAKYRKAQNAGRKTGPGSRIDGGGTPPKVP